MKLKCPKGIFVLVIFILVTSLLSIKYVLSDGNLIFFGFLLQGPIFQLYYLLITSLGVVTAIGLFLLKRWAFFVFLAENIFYICMFIVNSLFTTKDILLKVGWKDVENLLCLYQASMIVAVFLCIIFIGWIFFYRRYFFNRKK